MNFLDIFGDGFFQRDDCECDDDDEEEEEEDDGAIL